MFMIAALVFAGLALVLNIIGVAIPYWNYVKTSFGPFTDYNGLWKSCIRLRDNSPVCSTSDNPSDKLKAVRALEILGMLLMLGALCCLILKKFVMKGHTLLPKIGGGIAIAAGIIMIIGTIVYGTDRYLTPQRSNLNAGFALCVVAGVFGIVSAILSCLVKV